MEGGWLCKKKREICTTEDGTPLSKLPQQSILHLLFNTFISENQFLKILHLKLYVLITNIELFITLKQNIEDFSLT